MNVHHLCAWEEIAPQLMGKSVMRRPPSNTRMLSDAKFLAFLTIAACAGTSDDSQGSVLDSTRELGGAEPTRRISDTASVGVLTGTSRVMLSAVPSDANRIIGALLNAFAPVEYVVTYFRSDTAAYLEMRRLMSQDDQGRPNWSVLDVIQVQLPGPDDTIALGLCHVNNNPAPFIVAVAVYTDTEYFMEIHRAWRADTASERLEVIPVTGIKCTNESYGI